MAAALRKFSLLAAGAAAWDDTMVLVQRLATDETWANNATHMSRQDQLLSAGDTGSWCLTSMDSANGISGCWGTPAGQPCTRCVNGLVTCSHGTKPLLDYHGKTFCATADKRDSCFEKGCEPGGCCEQTCCPPQLKKDQSVLIREHGERKAKAAAAMLVAKEKDVKELAAVIKAEVSEMMYVAKEQAPTAIPKERMTQTMNMKKMQGDLKGKTDELRKIQAESPTGLAKLKKYHQQQLREMKGEIDHAKGNLQKSLGNPFSMASEKQTELKVKTGEIQKLEYTYENEKKALKAHQADRARQLKSLQATVEKRQAQVNQIRVNPAVAQTAGQHLKVSQIKAIQDQINAKEAHLHALKDKQRQESPASVKKMESELRAVKAKLMAARFGGQKQMVADLEAQADRLDQSYQNLKVSAAENKVKEANEVSTLQDEIYRLKAAAAHASHISSTRGQAQGLLQADAALKEAQTAYARAKEIVANADQEDAAKLEGLLSQIAAKKGQRRQAAMNHRSPVHGEMESFIKNHEDAYKQAKEDFAKQEAERFSHDSGKVKALEGDIKTLSKKLQKTAFGMAPALVKVATDQQSDIHHLAKDVAGKAAVLAAKEKELKTAKVQGKKAGMHKI